MLQFVTSSFLLRNIVKGGLKMKNINKDTVEIFLKNVKWLRKTNKLSKKTNV